MHTSDLFWLSLTTAMRIMGELWFLPEYGEEGPNMFTNGRPRVRCRWTSLSSHNITVFLQSLLSQPSLTLSHHFPLQPDRCPVAAGQVCYDVVGSDDFKPSRNSS